METAPKFLDKLRHAAFGDAKTPGPQRPSLADQVHGLRLRVKRLRALLALLRPHLSERHFKSARALLRRIARALAASRDQAVIQVVLASLSRSLPRREAIHCRALLREQLTAPPTANQTAAIRQADTALRTFVRLMPLPQTPPSSLREFSSPALKKTYRQARGAMKRARKTRRPSDFHRGRRRAKSLLLQLKLLRTAGLDCDKRIITRLDKLQSALGDLNDLEISDEFLSRQCESLEFIQGLHQAVRRRRRRLIGKLRQLRPRALALKPRQFIEKVFPA